MSQGANNGTFHANCVVIADMGILIRGKSGSGKSTLSRRLIDLARQRGHFSRLVGDDRIILRSAGNQLIAEVHPVIAGQMELRGIGIVETKFEARAVIRLLVDCVPMLDQRIPDASALSIELLGVACHRISMTLDGEDMILGLLGVDTLF
jgi:serine kinase of HPr protein (carbohydrate metabolism regulator)